MCADAVQTVTWHQLSSNVRWQLVFNVMHWACKTLFMAVHDGQRCGMWMEAFIAKFPCLFLESAYSCEHSMLSLPINNFQSFALVYSGAARSPAQSA